MALIDLARATELIPNFPSSDNALMTDLIDASSDVIERYCNRVFAVTTYDEVTDGPGAPNLLLSQTPIVYVDRVLYNLAQTMYIRNTDMIASRANFRTDGTTAQPSTPRNMYLVTVKNGITTTRTIDLTTTVTYNDLANAINAYSADGWAAAPLGIFATWPVSEMYPMQGGKECRWFGNAYLELHSWSMSQFTVNPVVGEIVAPQRFNYGYRNYRVIYQAGYSTIPEPIQQACAALAVSIYSSRGQNATLSGESLGGYSYTNAAEKTFKQLDIASRYGLELYKNHRIAKFKVGY